MIPPARLRRWTLLSAPVLVLSAWVCPACVPPAMLLWSGLGVLVIPRQKQPCPRKKRPMLHRLFFMGNTGCLFMLGFLRISGFPGSAPAGSMASLPQLIGAGFLSAVGWERAGTIALTPAFAWVLDSLAAAGWMALLLLW